MKTIHIAVDGKEFTSKLDCRNHETELYQLQALVFKAMDSGVLGIMKRRNSNNTIVEILSPLFKKEDFRFNCGNGMIGFKIYDRYGFKEFIVFKHKGRRLKILTYAYDECESWIKYIGSVYLNKL